MVEIVANFVEEFCGEKMVANVARVVGQLPVQFSPHFGVAFANLAVLDDLGITKRNEIKIRMTKYSKNSLTSM